MKNILVISLKFLGDNIVATPALRALHESFPDSKLTMMIREGYEEVFAGNPAVDEIISVPFHTFSRGTLSSRFAEQLRTIMNVRRRKFEVVLVLESGDREAILAWTSGARIRIGPEHQPLKVLFNRRIPVREQSISFLDYYCLIADAAGATVKSKHTELFVSPENAAWAASCWPSEWRDFIIVALHPGAREADRQWPAQRWGELATKILAVGSTRIVLITGPGEQALGDAITATMAANDKMIRVDELTVNRAAAIIQRCAVCITCDSAPRHIAAAVGTPTISLLPADRASGWEIYDRSVHKIVIGERCANGSWVDGISVDDVFSKFDPARFSSRR